MSEPISDLSPKYNRTILTHAVKTSERSEGGFNYESLGLGELEKLRLQKAFEALTHPALSELIDSDVLTLGIIRPNADTNVNSRGLSDIETEKEMLRFIETSTTLRVIFALPIVFTSDMVEEIWAMDNNQKARNLSISPISDLQKHKFNNRWEEYIDVMTSGASTVFLCYGEDAIDTLAKKKGNFVPRRALTGTIRREFASGLYNNLIHSPDSKDNVKRDVRVISSHLQKVVNQIKL